MHHALRLAAAIVACGLATACATPEHIQARMACAEEWEIRIPPSYQQILVNRERRVKVPDGTSSCTTRGDTKSCKQGMRTEWVPYTEVETVDVNARERALHIAQCARARCVEAYGNPECKT